MEIITNPITILKDKDNFDIIDLTSVDKIFNSANITIKPKIEADCEDILLGFALAGQGIAYTSTKSVQKHIEKGDLFKIKVNTQATLPQRDICIWGTADIRLSTRTSVFK